MTAGLYGDPGVFAGAAAGLVLALPDHTPTAEATP